MDTMQKFCLGLGALGVAGITGAAINAHFEAKEQERKEVRDKIYDLESKVRQANLDIESNESNIDRLNDKLNETNRALSKHLTEAAVKASVEKT